jgi:hypothetical protein
MSKIPSWLPSGGEILGEYGGWCGGTLKKAKRD